VNETPGIKPPRAYRVLDRALVAGVAAGLSAHSRIPVWIFRMAFVVASFWKFSGAIAYAVMWVLMPKEEKQVPIGLVAAERQGLRAVARKPVWPRVIGWVGSCVVGLGIAYVVGLYDTSVLGTESIPICVVGIGIGVVWLSRETTWPRGAKIATVCLGVVCAWTAGALVQAHAWAGLVLDVDAGTENLINTFFVAGTAMIACGVVLLPWVVHPARSEEEKQAELIAQTRADMASHLHDSVLQTLAVIQQRASDPKAVTGLARSQEKELREWLYGERLDGESAKSALRDVISEVEATYPVAVELVTVGDHEMTVEIDAVVRAAREAILNAAKHSGADKVDVYAEIRPERAEVFIRDRGRGFRMDDVDPQRMGIRRSIIDRMARYGGKVDIRSTPGEGTEVHVAMPMNEEGAVDG